MGVERKSLIISEEEKRNTAFHEAGHAVVAETLPNTDVVHKISIVPRGIAALGYTIQLPTEDRFLMTQKELEDKLRGIQFDLYSARFLSKLWVKGDIQGLTAFNARLLTWRPSPAP
jgi:hypothetical protein